MTIEEMLKDCILSKYKSVRQFCVQNNFAYSTIDGILKRGLYGSSINVVMQVCEALGISIDELAKGKIIEKSDVSAKTNISLSRRQAHIIELFDELTTEQQDNLIGRAEMLVELNAKEYKQEENA